MEYEKLFDVAKKHIQKLKVGTVFSVKELFSGTDWNKLSRGDKLGFGRFFKKSIATDTDLFNNLILNP